jgi:hypothetical protein
MTLLLSDAALAERRALVQRDPHALGGLARSLQRELHAWLDVPVPAGKARLTRFGGRCPTCTVLLAFDPRQPHTHRCPQCGVVQTAVVHHQWWLMNAHLWTAEQCTRAAVLAALLDDARAAARADTILETYADHYLRWPNADNVLGPTRPFFSTYLESIWLLHLTLACELRERAGVPALARVRDALIAPSAALIAGYDEGRSNRQVWNVAALLAASRVLGDTALHDRAVTSLLGLLRDGLHADGSWYEGENYHLFAHRGLLSAVTLAEQSGVQLPDALAARFHAGFSAPFRTMLPDGTIPSRRDSQYAVPLRQYRTAEWLECGFARTDTAELRAALSVMYADARPGETGRATSTADAERNGPGVLLTRADLNWRALLLAREALPVLSDAPHGSALLEGQGFAVFRRNSGRFWVGVDYGDPGAGHGHADRLNLTIATRTERLLDDVGTGSYTAPTLAWYRSTMAHNAPMVNGRDQGSAAGELLAFDEHDDFGWIVVRFTDPESQVVCVRTVWVGPSHVVDDLEWTAPTAVVVDLPLHTGLNSWHSPPWVPFVPGTTMDAWLRMPHALALSAGDVWLGTGSTLPDPHRPTPRRSNGALACACVSLSDATLWRAETIGPPGGERHGVLSLRQAGRAGRSVRVLAVADVADTEQPVHSLHVSTESIEYGLRTPSPHILRREADGSSVQLHGRTIHLRGRRPAATRTPETPIQALPGARSAPPSSAVAQRTPWSAHLAGADHWRRTETSWHDAGEPSAQVLIRWDAGHITVAVEVRLRRAPHFAPAVDENPLDNEHPDTNSDGVQLHWRSRLTADWNGALLVPEANGVRTSMISGTADGLTASWSPTTHGYRVTLHLPWPDAGVPFVVDLCVNERPPERERRRGQLVLSGARDEFGYLRGARQSDERALSLLFAAPVS